MPPLPPLSICMSTSYKGFDCGDAVMRDNANNEIVQFVEGRYICTSKGVWRLLCFDMHEQFALSCGCLSTWKISNMSVGVISGASLKWFVTNLQTPH